MKSVLGCEKVQGEVWGELWASIWGECRGIGKCVEVWG